jgi:hypothetical protein
VKTSGFLLGDEGVQQQTSGEILLTFLENWKKTKRLITKNH